MRDSRRLLATVKENNAPCGELGVAQSRPPRPSISERLMDKPIPIPCAFVVKNGAKMRSQPTKARARVPHRNQ